MKLENLIDMLYNEPDPTKRKYVPDKLAKLGDWRSTEHLGKILLDASESPALRTECAESLGKQGDPNAVEYLQNAVTTSIDELRRTIIWSFGQIGDPKVIPILIKFYDDENLMVRRWVAKSLGRVRDDTVPSHLKLFYKTVNHHDLHVKADILRAVNDQINVLKANDVEFWLKTCISNLHNEVKVHITLSSCKLLEDLLKINSNDLIDEISELLNKYDLTSPVRPHLLNCVGLLGEKDILLKEPLSPDTINALSLANYYEKHIEVLNKWKGYSDKMVEVVLKTIPFNLSFSLTEFLDSSKLGIRVNALEIHAKRGGSSEKLFKEINRKLSYSICTIFPYYVDETKDIALEALTSSDKVLRQTALRTIIESPFIEKFRTEILQALKEMALTDKVWHIRRDARNYIQDLK